MGCHGGENILDRLRGWDLVGLTRACFIASTFLALAGCGAANLAPVASLAPADSMDTVRNTDFSARFPVGTEGNSGSSGKAGKTRESAEPNQPFLFPGSDVQPERPRDRDPELRTASLQQAAFMKGD